MIKPTVGRSILFRPIDEDDAGTEHAAIIAFVHDNNHVNLAIFDSNGLPYNRQNVYLNQNADDVVYRGQAYWMPYQHKTQKIMNQLNPPFIEIDLESTKQISEKSLAPEADSIFTVLKESMSSRYNAVLDSDEFNEFIAAPVSEMLDGAVRSKVFDEESNKAFIKMSELSDMSGQLINRQLASHQIGKTVQ